MQRYFFHFLCKEEEFVSDTKGHELEDLAAAHRHAMQLIHKMIAHDDLDWKGWSIKITDASGRSVLSVLCPQFSYPLGGQRWWADRLVPARSIG
ncbi:MAG: hypothetical protein ABW003_27185 [Microvirga sp.]